MSVIFILIAISLLVATGFSAAYLWSVNNGQYDDDYTPAVRMLFDNTIPDSTADEVNFSSTDTDKDTKK